MLIDVFLNRRWMKRFIIYEKIVMRFDEVCVFVFNGKENYFSEGKKNSAASVETYMAM